MEAGRRAGLSVRGHRERLINAVGRRGERATSEPCYFAISGKGKSLEKYAQKFRKAERQGTQGTGLESLKIVLEKPRGAAASGPQEVGEHG